MRILNVEQLYINGRKSTVFDLYELQGDVYVFIGSKSIKGHFKRESTILKKLAEQGDY